MSSSGEAAGDEEDEGDEEEGGNDGAAGGFPGRAAVPLDSAELRGSVLVMPPAAAAPLGGSRDEGDLIKAGIRD